jgi:hypothetical protein
MSEKEGSRGSAGGPAQADDLAKSVQRGYDEALRRSYGRAGADTDTSKPPPSAAPEPTGSK